MGTKITKNFIDHLKNCIVSINAGNKKGSGFFIAPGLILTCFHVIEDVLETNLVEVLYGEKTFQCIINSYLTKPYPDLAFLEFPKKDTPCLLLDNDLELGDKLYCYGFNEKMFRGDSISFEFEGFCNGPDDLIKLKGGQAVHGFSGSPIVNLRTKKTIGILKASRDIYSDLGGYAVPSETILQYNKEVSDYQLKIQNLNHDEDGLIFKALLKNKVKYALQTLGYTIIKDKRINESKIDFLCEFKDSIFTTKVFVKIIDYKRANFKEEVDRFLFNIYNIFGSSIKANNLLITDLRVHSDDLEYSDTKDLKIISLTDLFNYSFDTDSVANYQIENFKTEEISRMYIDLSCQISDDHKGTIYKPVEKFFDKFFHSTKQLGIAILGNFGTGKSSLCKHYSFLLSENWLKRRAMFLPIYLNLRDLNDFYQFEEKLLTILNNEYKINTSKQGLLYWLREGNTLLILDGFDEMASKMDKQEINKNLRSLQQFGSRFNTKFILTCRTHFFKTQVEENLLSNMLKLYILDWGRNELIQYITRYNAEKAEKSLKLIHETYNLEELAKTPIFLNMISKSLDELGSNINQAKLYEVYTNRWIQNQDYRSFLSPEEKQQIMEELAIEMFFKEIPNINYLRILPILVKINPYYNQSNLDKISNDIRTCSFLIRTPEGNYHFVHKSFMEFFVALHLTKGLKENNFDDLCQKNISFEIASFISHYFSTDIEFIINHLNDEDTITKVNLIYILGCFPTNPKIFKILISAIYHENNIVKIAALDSLSLQVNNDVAEELVKIVLLNTDLSIPALKKLYHFTKFECVINLFQKSLLKNDNYEIISLVLEIISSRRINILFDSCYDYFKSGSWKKSEKENLTNIYSIRQSLIEIFELTDNHYYAKEIEKFEGYIDTSKLRIIYGNIIKNLSAKFLSAIEHNANLNFYEGLRYNENEGKIRKEFGIISDDSIKYILNNIYKSDFIKEHNKKIQGHKRKNIIGSQNAN